LASFLKGRSRTEIVFAAVLALWALLSYTRTASGFAVVLGLAAFALGAVLLFRLMRYVARQSIWRLRNRLIVTYLFIGVIPVALIVMLIAIGGYILAGQIAVFLVKSELERREQSLSDPAQVLSWSSPDTQQRILNQMAPFIKSHFPRLEILVHTKADSHFPTDSKIQAPPAGWKDLKGIVEKDGRYYEWVHVLRDNAEVVMIEPLTNRILSELVPHLGQVLLSSQVPGKDGFVLGSEGEEKGRTWIPPAANQFDREVTWASSIPVADWKNPGQMKPYLLVVTTRPSSLMNAIFGEQLDIGQLDIGQLSLIAFLVVAGLFLLVELVSFVIGIRMTKTITGAVHNLYEGTEKVTSGDFTHRIEVRGRDQLAHLTSSFNSMTENLERLFVVEKEKERLQSELEIAKEVQNQLFPKDAPELKTMRLTGVCKPARMVSGDYYDFFCLDHDRVVIAIGDVAGKGISAALLMAAIQSIMRAQLTHMDGVRCLDTALAVSMLNKQLHASTSAAKYATFCFGVYDERTRELAYTNAGHLPPMLVRSDQVELLEVTGTVVGMFPVVKYEERKITLQRGDLLVAYTDGIPEPENEYGEEFGEQRLMDLLLRHQDLESEEIIARVMESVQRWNSAPELPDDMTLLVAKVDR
jgi:sigma-B regulation protein RsbU (phosphoserine phosphatase)